MSLSTLIHYGSDANVQFQNRIGMTSSYMHENLIGFATMAYQIELHGLPREPGAIVEIESALAHLGRSSLRIAHRVIDGRTRAPIATLAQYGVHFDRQSRRPDEIPSHSPQDRRDARAAIAPALHRSHRWCLYRRSPAPPCGHPSSMLDKTYSPADIEQRIYEQWEASGAFRAGQRPDAEPFTIVIPPPNVTGSLHMGHALNDTIQDILARFERMRGRDVLWQPGMDHAGIATQMVVERQLAQSGENRRDMGREEFIRRVWAWKEQVAARSSTSSSASARRATGAASASPWTRACRKPC
jgi:acyl-CoA thioesterase FadM